MNNNVTSAGTKVDRTTKVKLLALAPLAENPMLGDVMVKKRDDILPAYIKLIKTNASNTEVQKLNEFIINKWSNAALIYIKEKAWKFVNDELKNKIELKNIVVLGQFTDGKIRQIITTKIEQLNISRLLIQMSKDGKITAMEDTIESLSWKSDVDLRS